MKQFLRVQKKSCDTLLSREAEVQGTLGGRGMAWMTSHSLAPGALGVVPPQQTEVLCVSMGLASFN